MSPSGAIRRRLRPILLVTAALLLAATAYGFAPRRADLVAFDPAEMGRLEMRMWRDYYEKRYLALFLDLYTTARREQGFSPFDSVRIALAAARAAKTFQPSASRTQAQTALPLLMDYFRLLAKGAPVSVDFAEVAGSELAWWQARREKVPPESYGLMVARVSTLLYGRDNEDIRLAGQERAAAMAYRDARGSAMTEADWTEIDRRLHSAYALLKRGVAAPAR